MNLTPSELKQLRDLAIDICFGYPVAPGRDHFIWPILNRHEPDKNRLKKSIDDPSGKE